MFRCNRNQAPTGHDPAQDAAEALDLDSVFNRLQVTAARGKQPTKTNSPDSTVNPKEEFEKVVAQKLKAERRRGKRKCIVRKACLILPNTERRTSTVERELGEEEEEKYSESVPGSSASASSSSSSSSCSSASSNSCSSSSTSEAHVSCGAQHVQQTNRQTHGQSSSNGESNAEELASYFEQMLVMPKPMSLMAEMMYA